ncbi:hypothetical protein E2C01_070333 [Portunus trituberculatus]|uniref:Uncharacterized protein n=1 Tax=Portunus trituberculatus TaxID=210409 RepID=A0A5B7I108_PORTR|nr:hypothetical protein [Portunus trituberculatus]
MPIVSILQEGHERQAHAFLRDAWLTSTSTSPSAAACPCRLPPAASLPRDPPAGGEALLPVKNMTPQARSEGSQRPISGGRAWWCPSLPILLVMLVMPAAPSLAATHGRVVEEMKV